MPYPFIDIRFADSDFVRDNHLMAAMNAEEKESKVIEIFQRLMKEKFTHDLMAECGYDYLLCSRVACMLATKLYSYKSEDSDKIQSIVRILGIREFDEDRPITMPFYMPVRYGGSIGWERIFIINRCSFPTADALIGIRSGRNTIIPKELINVVKGLTDTGLCYGNWSLFRIDPLTTDDMTSMVSLGIEKNFDLEFAYFPKDMSPEVIFRWIDS